MSATLIVSPIEQYTLHHPTVPLLIKFCQIIWPTTLPCQLSFSIDDLLISEDSVIPDKSVIQLTIQDLMEVEWVPPEQLLQTRLLCSKRSWINYSREYECFEVYSLHPKTQELRRALYYTDIKGIPGYYCTPTYLQRKRILKKLLHQ
jgi:hypothetical protein